MELHSFVPPVPPVENARDAAGLSSSSPRLSGINPIQAGGKAALGSHSCGVAAVRARDKHGNGRATTSDKTLSVGASWPASDDCPI